MTRRLLLLVLLQLLTASGGGTSPALSCTPSRVGVIARGACLTLLRLRGGVDDLDAAEDGVEEEDAIDDDVATAGDAALENPFLSMPSGGAGGGMGLEDIASTLKDPQMLQDALKELQDPAVQQQVKAMMEDPAFQESIKQYMEQITKDPQFEALKQQAEQLVQQEGFMDSLSKAFATMGGDTEGAGGGEKTDE